VLTVAESERQIEQGTRFASRPAEQMNSPIFSSSSDSPSVAPKRGLPAIFQNERGLRSGWRLAIYVAVVFMLWIGCMTLVTEFVRSGREAYSPWVLGVGESVSFGVAFGAAWIMSRFEERSLGKYGLPLQGAFGKLFWLGWLVGLGEVSALIALIAAFGGYSFGDIALHGSGLLGMGISWAILFTLVGLFEEFLFRGYTQYTLTEGIGFWPAAIMLSASFGLVHRTNPGEGWAGVASVVVIGLVFCFALKRTGNLWFCVGMHAAFDFGETFLFSVPDSGVMFSGHLSNASLHGKTWLTGGSIGPEGSVFNFITMGIVALVIHVMFPAKTKESIEPESAQAPAI
jgi:membrane protease YdiL (CAAX protease family)